MLPSPSLPLSLSPPPQLAKDFGGKGLIEEELIRKTSTLRILAPGAVGLLHSTEAATVAFQPKPVHRTLCVGGRTRLRVRQWHGKPSGHHLLPAFNGWRVAGTCEAGKNGSRRQSQDQAHLGKLFVYINTFFVEEG